MQDMADNVEQEPCTESRNCSPGGCEAEACDIEDCALGCNDAEAGKIIILDEQQQDLVRLRQRVAELEESLRSHARREICSLMGEVASLERHFLGREYTTKELKEAGMKVLGIDR